MLDEKKIEEAANECSEIALKEVPFRCADDVKVGAKLGIEWFKKNIWHDATKNKEPQGVSTNRGVLVIGIRKGRVAYQYLWTDMEDCHKDLDILVDQVPKIYSHALWAYVRDLIPFNLLQEKL